MAADYTHAMRSTGGQDRARVAPLDDGLIVVLADGAGGTGSGAAAAQAVVDAAVARSDGRTWSDLLLGVDASRQRAGGQSTAIILAVTSTEITGASVGDSEAWLIRDGSITELTANQHRKPLVGSGCAPVAIRGAALGGATLLVASDGLFRYARRDDIVHISSDIDLDRAADALLDMVRLPSGQVPDDVTVVLVRLASP